MKKTVSLASAGLLILIIASVFVGCEKGAGSREKVTIALPALPHAGLVHLAGEKNYFEQEGLDVAFSSFTSGKAALDSLMEGKADLATAAETPVVFAALKGVKILIVCGMFTSEKNVAIIAGKDRGIVAPRDLKGKKVGVTAGSNGEYFLSTFLGVNGLGQDEITMVKLKPEEMAAALTSGQVDAVTTWNPFLLSLQKDLGGGGTLFYGETFYTATHNVVTTPDFAAKHPETIKKILRALVKAEAFVRAHPEEAQTVIAAAIKMEKSQLSELWDIFHFRVALDQALVIGMENEARWAIKNKLTDKTVVPNFLDSLYFQGLDAVKPEAVTVIH